MNEKNNIVKLMEIARDRGMEHQDILWDEWLEKTLKPDYIHEDVIIFTIPDVRNKLTSIKNLIAMIENGLVKGNVQVNKLISDEIDQCKKTIEYLLGE